MIPLLLQLVPTHNLVHEKVRVQLGNCDVCVNVRCMKWYLASATVDSMFGWQNLGVYGKSVVWT